MVYALRLKILMAVLGGLMVNVPISATSAETSLGTETESVDPAEASPVEKRDPLDSAASDTGTEIDAGTETDTAATSDAAASAPAAASDTGAEHKVAPASVPAAKSAPASASQAAETGSRNSVGLLVLVSSIYNYRGLNVYKETAQSDQHALFSPAVTGRVFHPGLWLKYAGFFQINGDNRGYLVNSGAGAEQNVAVGFDYELSDKLKLAASLTYRFYPFALSRITGVEWPSYLEPAVGIHFATERDIRLGLQLSYFGPIQERLRDRRYMYTLLSVGKAIQFHPKLALDFDFSFGYKLFADPSILQDTIFDLEFCISVPFTVSDRLKLVPGMHAAWAYFDGTRFGDQYMIYFSLDLVADF